MFNVLLGPSSALLLGFHAQQHQWKPEMKWNRKYYFLTCSTRAKILLPLSLLLHPPRVVLAHSPVLGDALCQRSRKIIITVITIVVPFQVSKLVSTKIYQQWT
jgi:hypothetical protein